MPICGKIGATEKGAQGVPRAIDNKPIEWLKANETENRKTLFARKTMNRNLALNIILALFVLLLGCGRSDKPQSNATSNDSISTAPFDIDKVPEDLRDLAPLAQKWGNPDDAGRAALIESASAADLQVLRDTVVPRTTRITEWLDSFPHNTLSNEAAAFMYLLELIDELSNE